MTQTRTAKRRPMGVTHRAPAASERRPTPRPAAARAPAAMRGGADTRSVPDPTPCGGDRGWPAAAAGRDPAPVWRAPWWAGWVHIPMGGLGVLGILDLWFGRVPGRPELVLVLTVLGLLAFSVFSLRSQALAPAFCGPCPGRGRRPRVALTFDDGPDPLTTPHLLAALGEARATFLVVGERARAHPDLIAALRTRGHALAAHGERHSWRALLTVAGARRLVEDGLASLHAVGAPPSRYFRPPYGLVTPPLIQAVRATGLTLLGWSRRSWDTLGFRSPERFARRLAARVRDGDIVLLHDATTTLRRRPVAGRAMVATLVAELSARGFAFVTLEEM